MIGGCSNELPPLYPNGPRSARPPRCPGWGEHSAFHSACAQRAPCVDVLFVRGWLLRNSTHKERGFVIPKWKRSGRAGPGSIYYRPLHVTSYRVIARHRTSPRVMIGAAMHRRHDDLIVLSHSPISSTHSILPEPSRPDIPHQFPWLRSEALATSSALHGALL